MNKDTSKNKKLELFYRFMMNRNRSKIQPAQAGQPVKINDEMIWDIKRPELENYLSAKKSSHLAMRSNNLLNSGECIKIHFDINCSIYRRLLSGL
ncbi:site-specific recombinase XerD [Pseudochrobactrum saccharolyticum]|uniref:Site-specific recombinase XerD n=1 Tax=Pseudochrobactrum saccharolyticum TaxID=354352 RepID=A0A7W8AM63_9HYPH|nr:site-specific recombinase XerD [Pseudochrobactrum saccharolyticum]